MAEQPLPTAGQQDVTESLIALLRERQRKGIETYGRSLETFNGRDATRDLVEELIDAVQYARQWQLERADLTRQRDEAVQRAERAEQEVEGFSQANAIVNATLKQTTAQLERAEGAEFDIRYQVEEQRQRAERAESDLAACQTRYQASQEALTEAIEEMRAVTAENERLRAALKPFAELGVNDLPEAKAIIYADSLLQGQVPAQRANHQLWERTPGVKTCPDCSAVPIWSCCIARPVDTDPKEGR